MPHGGGRSTGHVTNDDDGNDDAEKKMLSFLKKAVIVVGSLVRILVEPREEEQRLWRMKNGGFGRGSKVHPSRRGLNEYEESLHGEIEKRLVVAWTGQRYERDEDDDDELASFLLTSKRIGSLRVSGGNDTVSSLLSSSSPIDVEPCCRLTCERINYLSLIEYRLGVFFRKMTPSDVYRSISRRHFERVVTILSSSFVYERDDVLYKKASFWLATFGHEEYDNEVTRTNGTSSSSSFSHPKITKCPKGYVTSLYSGFAER